MDTKKEEKKIKAQSRNWIFTDFGLLDIEKLYEEHKDIIRFIAWGDEIAPTTGRRHWQGWIQFKNKKRKGIFKKLWGRKIYNDPRYGSEFQNEKYCAKDGKYKQLGTLKFQGHRTDLEHVKKMIDENVPMIEIADAHFGDFLRYHSGFTKYRQLVRKEQTKKFRNVEVIVRWGKTGTGKTRGCYNPDKCFKIEGSKMQWWDDYEGEEEILIDEYSTDVKITELLNILDGYQLRLAIKGGFTYANWKKVYITSNIHPDEWHSEAKQIHKDALARRITLCAEVL